ncbi:MAG: hydrolase [Ignavibacteria bacterium]|nr:hydrolase [Ignavibacteria bacterium]
MKINRDNSIAVVIDVQQKLFPFIHEKEKLSDNIVKLIKGIKVLGIPILVTEQYSKGLGNAIQSVQEAIGNYSYTEKMSFSCCGSGTFTEALKKSEKDNVIICGIEAHVCVLQTVLDLIIGGYQPVVVENCISSRSLNDKEIAIDRMRQEGAVITTYESILFELLEVSGTEEFKAISKIIK